MLTAINDFLLQVYGLIAHLSFRCLM